MDEAQWEVRAAALAAEQAKRVGSEEAEAAEAAGLPVPTLPQMRRALIEIDRLLRRAPTKIQRRYKAIDEAALRALERDAQARLDEGGLDWLVRDPVEAAAAQARALDRHLFEHRDPRGKPDDVASCFLCPTNRVHVLPRPRADQPDAGAVITRTYRRRGLVRHRLIPEKIGDYTIELQWHPDLSVSYRRSGAKVVGALFRDLSLVRDEAHADFVAREAPCADEAGSLAEQVASAYAGDVLVALWPELTMPGARRGRLAAALRRMASGTAPGQGPVVVAAGSWHEVDGGKVRNRMHVMSGAGRPRFFHDKSLPLESRTLGTEELVPSYRLPVLVAEDALVAFAICRDFCEAQISKVYRGLDVDLIVVPSYGDAKTIRAHRQQAYNVSVDFGTRVFVVQQVVPEEVAASATGYVLPPDADPTAIDERGMRAEAPHVTHPISFRRV